MTLHTHSPIPLPRPFVLSDVGPDGQPQAMLVCPSLTTVIDRETAASLIADLLLVLTPTPGVITAIGDTLTGIAG